MKNLIIILLFNLAANSIIFAQNTILDSVAIYHTNYFLDSIYMKVRTKIVETDRVAYSNNAPDVHSTTPFGIVFKGCTTSTYRVVDTMYVFTNTVWSQRVLIQTAWDTSSICSYPASFSYTTHYIWLLGSGMATGVAESNLSNTSFELFPNPADRVVNIQSKNAGIQRIIVYHSDGKLIDELEGSARKIHLSDLPTGLYYVRLELFNGEAVTKKLIVQKE